MKTCKKNLPGVIAAAFALTAACTTLHAQSAAGAGTTRSGSANAMVDTAFIGKNIRDNTMEIQMSQMAVDRGSTPAVKKAAQQLVTDHTQVLNDLTRLARKNNMPAIAGGNMNNNPAMGHTSGTGSMNTGTTGTTGMGTAGAGSTGTGTTGTGTSGATGGSTILGNTDSTNVGATAGATGTLGMGTQEMAMPGMGALRNASGPEFDRLWVTQMLSMHEAKLAELTASANTITDMELKAIVTQAIPKIRMHRDLLSKMTTANTSR